MSVLRLLFMLGCYFDVITVIHRLYWRSLSFKFCLLQPEKQQQQMPVVAVGRDMKKLYCSFACDSSGKTNCETYAWLAWAPDWAWLAGGWVPNVLLI
jgi:hypothetical protein